MKGHLKKGDFFSYFIVALIAAIVGGIISAYIAPTYLYGKVLPIPGNYDEKAHIMQDNK